jgi:GT2 family glycosyltransferase
MNKNKISVVIPTQNHKKDVIDAVKSLLLQSYPVYEIIVIDNASSDNTVTTLKKLIPSRRLSIIENSENFGVTGGRNIGLLAAKGDYILFFDHDIVADKMMVEKLAKCLESDKKIGIATPKIYYFDKRNIIWSAGTDVNLWTGQTTFYGGNDTGQYNTNREVAVAPAVLLVKKKVINKIGNFDQIYFATYEDTDFCFRARKQGFKTYYAPLAVAYHKIPFNTDDSNRRLLLRAYWIGRNRVIFMKKYSKNFILFLILSPIFFIYYLWLAIRYHTGRAVILYSKGFVNGLIDKSYLPFTYPWIFKKEIQGAKSILDMGCGDGSFMTLITQNVAKKKITGVELFNSYIQKANLTGTYYKIIKSDIKKIYLHKNVFDTIVASQVIEHITKDEGILLIQKMEKIAKSKVIIGTPNGFFHREESIENNHWQKHHSGWVISDFRQRGYKVYGQGLNFIYKQHGLIDHPLFQRSAARYCLIILSYILSPIVYFYPELSAHIIAVKNI